MECRYPTLRPHFQEYLHRPHLGSCSFFLEPRKGIPIPHRQEHFRFLFFKCVLGFEPGFPSSETQRSYLPTK
ncbi:hypothetical protein CEXT_426631 [Caerostris extrusa]|uniref:Uncharacterized protein n=1 Tax=Caerostris extrusa TaxID=172846 RepID=A0AAV4XVT0_CAEEX|nr:hypothetical protein CEXT_426631 [Caerostris extrusa]